MKPAKVWIMQEIVDVKSTSYGSNTVVDEALLPFFQVF